MHPQQQQQQKSNTYVLNKKNDNKNWKLKEQNKLKSEYEQKTTKRKTECVKMTNVIKKLQQK